MPKSHSQHVAELGLKPLTPEAYYRNLGRFFFSSWKKQSLEQGSSTRDPVNRHIANSSVVNSGHQCQRAEVSSPRFVPGRTNFSYQVPVP